MLGSLFRWYQFFFNFSDEIYTLKNVSVFLAIISSKHDETISDQEISEHDIGQL
jgi:hypothetical protein